MGEMLDNVAVAVLAGGLGTRLLPVVADRPKVLAPVGGRPFLARLLDQLAGAGAREVVLLTGCRADEVRGALGDEHAGMRLTYSVETAPLGTAGAVRGALPQLRAETVLLLNGDSYCDVDLDAFGRFHRGQGAGASLVLSRVADVCRFGQVRVASDGRVVHFEEKGGARRAGWINAGTYLLRRALLEELAPARPASLERDLLPVWVAAGLVRGFRTGARFIDIGTPESYGEAEAFFCAEGKSARAWKDGQRCSTTLTS